MMPTRFIRHARRDHLLRHPRSHRHRLGAGGTLAATLRGVWKARDAAVPVTLVKVAGQIACADGDPVPMTLTQ